MKFQKSSAVGRENLDAGQPEVVQRGSPWYKKLVFDVCELTF